MLPDQTRLMLNSVRIENFRAIKRATVPLHPQLTVLIGDNATGKTTVLEAIAIALQPFIRPFLAPQRRGQEIMVSDFRVEAGGDLFGSPYRSGEITLVIDSSLGEITSRYDIDDGFADKPRVKRMLDRETGSWLEGILATERTAPILAYYRDNRGQVWGERGHFPRRSQSARQAAYHLAFDNRVYFDEAVNWFEDAESAELRDQREYGSDFRDNRLSAVRRAVEHLIPEVSDLRMLGRPPELSMTLRSEGQEPRLLTAGQLSSGFRTMLALAMDLARRMADLNPHLENPTESPGVVLIDEIDLHLHPRWQQLVIKGLVEAFPNIQFIMSTHSPQVLTTLREENILKLRWENSRLEFEPLPSTEGAEAGRLLTAVMGVSERPPSEVSAFVEALDLYRKFLRSDQSDTPAALKALQMMQTLSPDDPVLATLDLEKRRLEARRG